MRAIIAHDKKPIFVDIPAPIPSVDEVLIAVRATALNRADLLQVLGLYPPPQGSPDTLGLELAGEIIALGDNVSRWRIGDRVMALVGGGGYAQKAVVHADHCMAIPADMPYEDATAIPEAFLTAYTNMIWMAGLKENERVLIHAGASGVGLAATQLACLIGATVIVTASAEKHAVCKANGATLTIDYKTENFADRLLQDYSGVNVIVDMVGAPYWADNFRVIEKWGRWVFIGTQGGGKVELNIGQLMSKKLRLMGSTLRDRTIEEKTQLIADFDGWAMSHVIAGALHPTIHTILEWDAVETAHDMMRQNINAGKIVLRVR
ncbi:MAG: NAD(P)H-quinone oxidoreductase [Phototrophicales bacterium]|jgi:putative PIG3 family NAD(P)H quinone oxidoreductase|nr:NAD(P)H-quinone oxidoreductase [Phototrophicales bacterium]